MNNWHDTDELDELLGGELDLDQAWSEFKKDKKKTRRIPIWWCFGLGSILLLGVVWFAGNYIKLKMDSKETAAVLLHPSVAIPSFEKTTLSSDTEQALPQKEVLSSANNSIKGVITTQSSYLMTSRQKINANPDSQKLSSDRKSQDNKSTYSVLSQDWINANQNNSKISSDEKSQNKKATPLPSLSLYLSPQRLEKIPIPYKIPLSKISPSFTSKKWSVGINYAIANAHRNLTGGRADYTQRRQEEQFLEANRIELSITRDLSTYFFFQTGLAWTQYRSRIEENIQTITSPVQFENVITETQTKDNLTEEIIGTATGSQLIINRFTRYQRYQTLSIPVQLGVSLRLSSQWQLRASTGVLIGVLGQSAGNTFASALPDGVYQPVSELNYRTAGMLEGIGRLNLLRSFGKSHVTVGLQGALDINNRFKDTTSGVDKFSNYGVQVGWQYDF